MVLSTSLLVIIHSNSTFSLTITSMTSCLDPCYLVFLFVKWSKSRPHFPYRHVQAFSPHHSSYHFWTFTLFVKHYVLQDLLFFCKNILFTFASHDISYLLELVMRIISVLWFYWESYWCSLDIMNDLPPSYFFHSLCDSKANQILWHIVWFESSPMNSEEATHVSSMLLESLDLPEIPKKLFLALSTGFPVNY